MPLTFTPDYLAQLVSVGDISKANGHSRMAIYKAIARLGIKPILESPFRLYDPGIVPDLKKAMRKLKEVL